MISVLNENQLFAACFVCKVSEIEEGGLGEFVQAEISKPHKESGVLLVLEAWETPKAKRTIKSNSRIDVIEFVHTSLYFKDLT